MNKRQIDAMDSARLHVKDAIDSLERAMAHLVAPNMDGSLDSFLERLSEADNGLGSIRDDLDAANAAELEIMG